MKQCIAFKCGVVYYGQLHRGFWRPGGQYKRYKDCLKTTLNQYDITPSELDTLARDRIIVGGEGIIVVVLVVVLDLRETELIGDPRASQQ